MKKKIYLDCEFHEYHKQPKVLGFNVGKPIPTVDLISIGMVNDSREEYYAICNEVDLEDAWENTWLRKNVLWEIYMDMSRTYEGKSFAHSMSEYDHLQFKSVKRIFDTYGKSKAQIAKEVIEFVAYSSNPELHPADLYKPSFKHLPVEFYAYYADYDWLVFAQLFGTMMDLPNGFPMYCKDLKQMLDEIGNPDHSKAVPKENEHNALADAKWNRKLHAFIERIKAEESVVNKYNNSDKTVPNLDDNWDTEKVSVMVSNNVGGCFGDNTVWIDKEEFDFIRKIRGEAVILGTAGEMERIKNEGHFNISSDPDYTETVSSFIDNQVDISPEIGKLVDDNFWDLAQGTTETVPAKDIADVDGNLWVDEVDNKSYVPGTDVIVSFDTTDSDSSSNVNYDSCND